MQIHHTHQNSGDDLLDVRPKFAGEHGNPRIMLAEIPSMQKGILHVFQSEEATVKVAETGKTVWLTVNTSHLLIQLELTTSIDKILNEIRPVEEPAEA